MTDLDLANPDPRLDMLTERASLAVNDADEFVLRITLPDGRVAGMVIVELTATDAAFTKLEAVHPMTEAERDAALARLEQYTGRSRSVPRPRDASAQ